MGSEEEVPTEVSVSQDAVTVAEKKKPGFMEKVKGMPKSQLIVISFATVSVVALAGLKGYQYFEHKKEEQAYAQLLASKKNLVAMAKVRKQESVPVVQNGFNQQTSPDLQQATMYKQPGSNMAQSTTQGPNQGQQGFGMASQGIMQGQQGPNQGQQGMQSPYGQMSGMPGQPMRTQQGTAQSPDSVAGVISPMMLGNINRIEKMEETNMVSQASLDKRVEDLSVSMAKLSHEVRILGAGESRLAHKMDSVCSLNGHTDSGSGSPPMQEYGNAQNAGASVPLFQGWRVLGASGDGAVIIDPNGTTHYIRQNMSINGTNVVSIDADTGYIKFSNGEVLKQ